MGRSNSGGNVSGGNVSGGNVSGDSDRGKSVSIQGSKSSLFIRLIAASIFVFVQLNTLHTLTSNDHVSNDYSVDGMAVNPAQVSPLQNSSDNNNLVLSSLVDSDLNETSDNNDLRRSPQEYTEAIQNLNQLPLNSTKRIAFLTFSYVKHNDSSHLLEFLLPAVDTWAEPTPSELDHMRSTPSPHKFYDQITLYVVFSYHSKAPFENACINGHELTPYQRKILCPRIHPIYVECPEGRFGESPCCKQQKGLLTIFQDPKYPLYDWYAFFDDDYYHVKDYLMENLMLHNANFPMAQISRSQDVKPLGWGKGKMCRRGEEFKYPWGHPIFYSRGGVGFMAKGYRAGSLVKQCEAFEVTHDVGNQILNWMYSLPVGRLPPGGTLPQLRNDFIGYHWAGRDDARKTYHLQPRDPKFPPLKPQPEGEFSFYKTHEKHQRGKNGWLKTPKVSTLFHVRTGDWWFKNVTGFRQTLTYARYGDPNTWDEGVWHTMSLSDCNGRG